MKGLLIVVNGVAHQLLLLKSIMFLELLKHLTLWMTIQLVVSSLNSVCFGNLLQYRTLPYYYLLLFLIKLWSDGKLAHAKELTNF